MNEYIRVKKEKNGRVLIRNRSKKKSSIEKRRENKTDKAFLLSNRRNQEVDYCQWIKFSIYSDGVSNGFPLTLNLTS